MTVQDLTREVELMRPSSRFIQSCSPTKTGTPLFNNQEAT